jgi:hypothetical protein
MEKSTTPAGTKFCNRMNIKYSGHPSFKRRGEFAASSLLLNPRITAYTRPLKLTAMGFRGVP